VNRDPGDETQAESLLERVLHAELDQHGPEEGAVSITDKLGQPMTSSGVYKLDLGELAKGQYGTPQAPYQLTALSGRPMTSIPEARHPTTGLTAKEMLSAISGQPSAEGGQGGAAPRPTERISFQDFHQSQTELLLELVRGLEESHLPEEEAHEGGRFNYIPLNPIMFVAGLRQAEQILGPQERRFLDVGCGIGSKLHLARQLGWQVFGLEIRQDYLEVARKLVPGAMLAQSDAGRYADFAAHDLVYAYRPYQDDTACIGLEQVLCRELRPGALLWLPDQRSERLPLAQVAPNLWRKER
jgi:hypothetical protein